MYGSIDSSVPLLQALGEHGVELDQRMNLAFQLSARATPVDFDAPYMPEVSDYDFFAALLSLNPTFASFLFDDQANDYVRSTNVGRATERWKKRKPRKPRPRKHRFRRPRPHQFAAGNVWRRMLNRALGERKQQNTLGVNDYISAWIEDILEHGDFVTQRTRAANYLAKCFGHELNTPVSKVPELNDALQKLRLIADGADDFQYVVTLAGDRMAFRVTSLLGDYAERSASGVILPRRALITHFQRDFGGFTQREILELEELINNPKAKELEFQKFFTRHPHFFRRWDYREVHPHVTLRHPDGDLIPDFILTDRELQRAAILDLKRPKPVLIRRQHNRDRFAAAVMEARSQLLRYRDWFRERNNRRQLAQQVGIEIYEPQLTVIIGRSSAFQDAFDRQKLQADMPDVDLVTYDDLLRYAKRRLLLYAEK